MILMVDNATSKSNNVTTVKKKKRKSVSTNMVPRDCKVYKK